MDGGCDLLQVEIDVAVRPLNGVWENSDDQKGIQLRTIRSVVHYKELPTTSNATSGPFKVPDYKLSSTTAASSTETNDAEKHKECKPAGLISGEWMKMFPHMKEKLSSTDLDETKRKQENEQKSKNFVSASSKPLLEENPNSKKSSVRGPWKESPKEKRPKDKLTAKVEEPTKKTEEVAKEEAMEEEDFTELEYWMVVCLFWFFLLTWRYFLLVQMEIV